MILKIILILILAIFLCKNAVSEFFYLRTFEEKTTGFLSEDLEAFLSLPLSFLGIGSQCIAFSTENSPYVLKICKANRYQPLFIIDNPIVSFLFPSYLQQQKDKKTKRKQKDFQSYTLAKQHLSEQCGILYLHLDKTTSLNAKIKIQEPFLGISLSLQRDDLCFYIQKKATPFASHLLHLLHEEKNEELYTLFSKLTELFTNSCEKGLWIKDTHFQKNMGICKELPFWIDPGKVRPAPTLRFPQQKKERLDRFQQKLRSFIFTLDPRLEQFLTGAPS